MKLSAPVYSLKRLARGLSREEAIPLHAALDRVAQKEGFASWSLLAARLLATDPAGELLTRLKPGELVLVGARPGHGKTLMGLDLVVKAVKAGRQGWFFTLEWNQNDVLRALRTIGADPSEIGERFVFDHSDAISAAYIISRLEAAPSSTVVIIDYLQLLDQKRDNAEIAVQVRELKSFARERNLIIALLSQIDRTYDSAVSPLPELSDVRLPNPLDLRLFDKACFLNNGAVQFSVVS